MARDALVIIGSEPPQVVTWIRADTPAEWTPPEGTARVPEASMKPGWIPEVLPDTTPLFVTRWQIRQAMLRRFQITPEHVEAFIVATVTDPMQRASSLIDWRDAPIVRRDHALIGPFVAHLSSVIQATIDADEFFRFAASLDS